MLENTVSDGYMTVTAANTTRVYPTNLVGGTTTTAGSSIFDGDTQLLVTHVMVNTSGTTSGTIAIAGHDGVAVDTLDFDSLVAGNVLLLGEGRRTFGLSAIAAGSIAAADIKVYFTKLKQ